MSLLARWTWGSAARAVNEALAAARVDEEALVAVVEHPGIAAVLADARPVAPLATRARALRRARGRAARASAEALPLADGALAALVGAGAGERGDGAALLEAWARAVRDGGALVLVDRAPREEMTRRALAAGLRDIEQRVAGRLVVTSGVVRRLQSE